MSTSSGNPVLSVSIDRRGGQSKKKHPQILSVRPFCPSNNPAPLIPFPSLPFPPLPPPSLFIILTSHRDSRYPPPSCSFSSPSSIPPSSTTGRAAWATPLWPRSRRRRRRRRLTSPSFALKKKGKEEQEGREHCSCPLLPPSSSVSLATAVLQLSLRKRR